MKMKKTFLTAAALIAMMMYVAGCGSGPKAAGPDELDATIREASDYLNDNIPAGSKIVILNVQSSSAALSDYIIDELIANAVNDRNFEVVDRQQLDLIRQEQNFQWAGEVDDNLALEVGKFFGAQMIVSGRVSAVGDRFRFTVRALEVQTARVQGQNNWNMAAGKTITALMKDGGSGPSVAGNQASGGRASAGAQASGGSAASGTTQTATPARPAGPKNGTYTFWPRPQATVTGVNVRVYLDRVVVRGGYFTIYFSSTPQGYREGYSGDGGSHYQIAAWGHPTMSPPGRGPHVTLQDLDTPRLTWKGVNSGVDPETRATFTVFQGVTARRFSLTNTYDAVQVFEEINLDKAEYEE